MTRLQPTGLSGLTLLDLVKLNLLNVEFELVHCDDGDAPYATCDNFTCDRITQECVDDWPELFNAHVEGVYQSAFGLTVSLDLPSDVASMDMVKDFAYAQAGYCSEEDYDRWFTD